MARARNIKPGFFRNADLVELSFEARLLFIGLWTISDKAGRLEDRPKQIKMELFPADNLDCDALIETLAASGFVARYEVGGKRYLQVINFAKHQNPHRDEKASTIPNQCGIIETSEQAQHKHSASTVQALCEEDANSVAIGLIPDSLLLIPDSLYKPIVPGKPETGEVGQSETKKPNCPSADIVALYHELMPDNPEVKVLDEARKGKIRQRWKQAASLQCAPFGYSNRAEGLIAWRQFFEICSESPFLTGKVEPQPGKPPFIADIDFLMSPSGFARCLENKYHRPIA